MYFYNNAGKTTLTETLEEKLGAARYFTPPAQITHLRAYFDRFPEIVRRAYYSLGNYIVAMEIMKECQERPVIMDRYVLYILEAELQLTFGAFIFSR